MSLVQSAVDFTMGIMMKLTKRHAVSVFVFVNNACVF